MIFLFFTLGLSIISRLFEELLDFIDGFPALPDLIIHNQTAIEQISLNYWQEIPGIGFSKAYPIPALLWLSFQLRSKFPNKLVNYQLKSFLRYLKLSSYLRVYFSVAINQHGKGSLDLIFADPESIKLKLLALEK